MVGVCIDSTYQSLRRFITRQKASAMSGLTCNKLASLRLLSDREMAGIKSVTETDDMSERWAG